MVRKRVLSTICGIILLFLIIADKGYTINYNYSDKTQSAIMMPELTILKGIIKRGDTASSLLNKYLPLETIYKLSRQSKDFYPLTRIKRGQPYEIILQDNDLSGFEYEIDNTDKLVIQKEDDAFSVDLRPIKYDVKLEVVGATITNSLFGAVKNAGEHSELAIRLSDIFAWDIDFIRDIQPGDRFKVLVEKRYKDGKLAGYGEIQVAFFTSQGYHYKAFFHKNANGVTGYFDENGGSLQKAFLKVPLSFSRISSKFTKRRLHPIFKEYRPHPGVDYAAPKGTPIKTVGDGTIIKMGYNKGMGNFIKIRHANGYETDYNHMSKFAKGMKRNKRVTQGQVIGYVGATGYATGPHLDFRMKKNGKLIDPLTHKSPPTNPIKPDEMEKFLARVQKLSTRIMTAGMTVKL